MLSRISSFSGPLSKLFTAIKNFTLNGLILRYELSDTNSYSGTTTVTDLVSSSNATLYNGPTYSINGYINFDGSNDYLITNTSLNSKLSPPNTSTVISCFVWVYPQNSGIILSEQGSPSLDASWFDSQIEIVSGSLKFRVWPGGALSSSISISLYNWYYLGFTYNGTTLKGYVNGQFAGSYNISRQTPWNNNQGNPGTGLFYALGYSATNLGSNSYAKMKFGSFHIYNTALSQQQILNNYNSTKSNYIVTGSMSIWIDANDPGSFSGGTVFDISGNGYNHTLTGATSSNIFGFKSFDCSTGTNRVVVNGTGPTLPTTGYTYTTWARLKTDSLTDFRTLLYTNSPKYTPITIPNNSSTLGYWDSAFRSSGYGLTSSVEKWVQYAVVGDSSSQTFYINGSQVGNSISFGAGGTTHWGWGNNDGASQPFGYIGNMQLYNKKLTQNEIKQNYDALKHVYSNGDFVVNNLVLYFNPASYLSYSGGSTINNLVSKSLNGTLSNVSFTNPYFTFNGSNSQVSITDNALLEPGSSSFTMEVWVNQSVAGNDVVIGKFDNGGASQDVSYSIRTTNTTFYAQIGSGVGSGNSLYINSTNHIGTLNTWYHIVYVFKNGGTKTLETFVNGSSIGTVTHNLSTVLNTANSLYMGSYNGGEYSQWFDGKIGIVRIYNSALSASDVSTNFETNRGIYGI